jgi:BlaI family penicillinase repressor
MNKKASPKKPQEELVQLPEAELEIMACLWQMKKATAREIRERMNSYRPMAHGSTVTLLKRLESKGLVKKQKGTEGKAFIYSAAIKPSPTFRSIVNKMLQRIFGGDSLVMVSTLFESKPPTNEELEQIQQLLDTYRNDTNSSGEQS